MEYYLTPKHYEIAKGNGISEQTLYARVYIYFWDIEKAIRAPLQPRESIGWEERKEIAEANGIKYATYRKRVFRGMDRDEAASKPVMTRKEASEQGMKALNRQFTDEQLEIMKANGINYRTAYSRVKRSKWTVEDAITKSPMSNEEVREIARMSPHSFQNNPILFSKKFIPRRTGD